MAKRRQEGSASEIFYKRYYKGKPKSRLMAARAAMTKQAIGDKIRALREQAGLTQAELARRVGTQPSQISRIEDADYDGHSVETLRRIAEALQVQLQIEFVSTDQGTAGKLQATSK